MDKISAKTASKNSRTISRRSFFPLLGALIIYKLLTMMLFVPAIKAFWALILRISPVHYITNDTLFSVLKIPYVPAAIIIIAILAAFWAMFEYSLIIIGLDHAFRAEKASIKVLCLSAAKEMEHALKARNLPILIYAAVLIPFTNIFISSNYISQLAVPEYIMEVIRKNGIYNALYIGLFVICIIVSFLSVFIFHAFIIDRESFAGAWKKSFSYVRRDPWRLLGILVKKNVSLLLKYIAVILGVGFTAICVLFIYGYYHGSAARSLGNAISMAATPILGYMVGCMLTLSQFTLISGIFYERRAQEPVPDPEDRKKFRIGSAAIVAASIVFTSLLTITLSYVLYMLPEDINPFGTVNTTISYHRGYCTRAPENTIPAFEAAIADGCDIIELDVQLTSDGVVVVTHDPSLKRVAGIDEYVSDLTFDELEKIDVGSFFSDEYSWVRIPTLEEVLKLCRGKTKLNIEIKQNGFKAELVEKTVQLIKEYDFIDNCTVTSLDYESLAAVKELEPAIRTGYILAVGVGSYYDLPAADFFSVEASFITQGMVSEIHLRGKTVSGWTINRYEDAARLRDLGVDDLITEDPAMVRGVLADDQGLGELISRALSAINPIPDSDAVDSGTDSGIRE